MVEIQAMVYNAVRIRRSSTKFQVDTCKTKKDRPEQGQLRQTMIYNAAKVGRLSTKLQVDLDTYKTKKKIDLRMHSWHLVGLVEIQAMIYNGARVRRLSTKFQVCTYKTKKDRSSHEQLHTL